MIFLRILLNNGAECDVTDNKDYTPLFYAAKADGIEASFYLLEYGKADPNFRCRNGKTPLFKATTYEDAMILMKYGADRSVRMNGESGNEDGKSPLEYLVENCYESSPLAIMDHDVSKEEDDTMKMDLELPTSAAREENELGLHKTFSDYARFDLFMHPIMEVFLDLKWRKFKRVFLALLILDLIFAISLSVSGMRFADFKACKEADERDEIKACQ